MPREWDPWPVLQSKHACIGAMMPHVIHAKVYSEGGRVRGPGPKDRPYGDPFAMHHSTMCLCACVCPQKEGKEIQRVHLGSLQYWQG